MIINSASIVTTGQFQLQVPCYRLWLSVGWTEAERNILQPIDIDLSITLEAAPLAAKTDHLEDTFCYATLLDTLAETSQAKSFKLLEHLAAALVSIGEKFLLAQGYPAVISVGVTKVCPPVQGIVGGIRIRHHNMPLSQTVTPCLNP
jgi:dihydroneopterin aldolase